MPHDAPTIGRREYASVVDAVRAADLSSRASAMRAVCDAVWEHHGLTEDEPAPRATPAQPARPKPVSWVGFYEKVAGRDEMVLAVRRDKPACSPIELHGMCGRSFLERAPIVIDNVATLGGDYIACDPRDVSELVIPLFENDGACWGVLDLDSYEQAAFSAHDAEQLTRLVELAGLSAAGHASDRVLRL